jgi:hypothetical protein
VTGVSAFRYFLTVRLHAPYALAILLVVFVLGLYLVIANPFSGLDDGLGMVLFVQMFLASTGFMERARRGHFDALLTISRSRTRALAAHWMVSILPGAAAWLLLSATALAVGSSITWQTVVGPRLVALFIVSALAWVVGFAMARGTAGFLWTAGLFATALHRTDLLTSISPVLVLFCPFALMRNGPIDVWPVISGLLLALLALLSVWRHAAHLDVCLVEQS